MLTEAGILFCVDLWVQVPGAVVGATDGCVIVRVPEIVYMVFCGFASTDV